MSTVSRRMIMGVQRRAVVLTAPQRTSSFQRQQMASFHQARRVWSEEKEAAKKETTEEKAAEAEAKDYEMLLKEKDEELKEAKDKILRTLADMQNLRDRTARDAENSRKYAITNFSKDILDVSDTLEMALASAENDLKEYDNKHLKSFYEGIKLTEKTLLHTFEKHGITRMTVLGEKFNPNFHNGLYQFEDPTKVVGTVGNVVKNGYMLKDKLLRAAHVGTVKAPVAPAAPDSSSS